MRRIDRQADPIGGHRDHDDQHAHREHGDHCLQHGQHGGALGGLFDGRQSDHRGGGQADRRCPGADRGPAESGHHGDRTTQHHTDRAGSDHHGPQPPVEQSAAPHRGVQQPETLGGRGDDRPEDP
ncbi:hypothetical protein SDC9_118783 [bioreactor metagenome]|uniref:Uncharacterized protein n=1 Tax=bioreactor metagenome TaxID=1076179 RepID=A0A645C2E5_9ZZZZ